TSLPSSATLYCISTRSPSIPFLNPTAPASIYSLSLHDALPISLQPPSSTSVSRLTVSWHTVLVVGRPTYVPTYLRARGSWFDLRSEEHTSELQSRENLVCRLLLEKKKQAPKQPGCMRSSFTTRQ